ncbi:MAG TPA: type II toxin-antitoxin system PemK/MazF family toxin [Humisphaera sp.]|nr:type II toxin-antitoxin system PemK/MazF family toxin [Humisphaera sp.]
MKTRANIRQRQIYWLDQCEPLDGDEEKDRPVIVLAAPETLRAADFILVVACSTHPRERDIPRFEVPSRQQAEETGLPKNCWAIARWYLKINRFRLTQVKGTCPEPIFTPILKAVLEQIDLDTNAAIATALGEPRSIRSRGDS